MSLRETIKVHKLAILRQNMALAARRRHIENCPNCQARLGGQSALEAVSPVLKLMRSLSGDTPEDTGGHNLQ